MRESNYWLRLIDAVITGKLLNKDLNYLIEESDQLKKILGSIVSKTNIKRGK